LLATKGSLPASWGGTATWDWASTPSPYHSCTGQDCCIETGGTTHIQKVFFQACKFLFQANSSKRAIPGAQRPRTCEKAVCKMIFLFPDFPLLVYSGLIR
jgi:hypothetical protein